MSELYLVSTPIGNLSDITIRAVDVLKSADFIVCEDTRVSGKLLAHYDIKKKLIIYNDHNKQRSAERILQLLMDGNSIAMITDAGTPGISDPGYYLVNKCIKNCIDVIPVPGASALTAALAMSGMPTDRFVFYGFTSRKKNARRKTLDEAASSSMTAVFYESPFRIDKTLDELKHINPGIRVAVCREMTKMHEECIRGSVDKVLEGKWKRKGEIVLLINGDKQ